ncbi:MAG: sigma-70 family RNA polymerase sigma factor [Candidatus Latescibacterota bacterium]
MLFCRQLPSDADLVHQVRSGRSETYGDLVARYRDVVYATALARVLDRDDAEDVAQEAFIRAYRQLDTLEDPGEFGGWIRRIAQHQAANLVRRRRASVPPAWDAAAPGADALAQVAASELRLRPWEALAGLPAEQRDVTLLFYMSERSVEETADLLGVPRSTVRGRLQRGRRKLREAFDAAFEEEVRQTVRERGPALPVRQSRAQRPGTAPAGRGPAARRVRTPRLGVRRGRGGVDGVPGPGMVRLGRRSIAGDRGAGPPAGGPERAGRPRVAPTVVLVSPELGYQARLFDRVVARVRVGPATGPAPGRFYATWTTPANRLFPGEDARWWERAREPSATVAGAGFFHGTDANHTCFSGEWHDVNRGGLTERAVAGCQGELVDLRLGFLFGVGGEEQAPRARAPWLEVERIAMSGPRGAACLEMPVPPTVPFAPAGSWLEAGAFSPLGQQGLGWPLLGDADGDGDADAVVGYLALRGPDWAGDVGWVTALNDGHGRFRAGPRQTLASALQESVPQVRLHGADLDGDGRVDLVVQQGVAAQVWLNRGDGSFRPGQPWDSAFLIGVADLDGDGVSDVLLAEANYRRGMGLRVLRGRRGAWPEPEGFYPLPLMPAGWAAGDLGGDASPDVLAVVNGPGQQGVVVLWNRSARQGGMTQAALDPARAVARQRRAAGALWHPAALSAGGR